MKNSIIVVFILISFFLVSGMHSDVGQYIYKEVPETRTITPENSYIVDEILVVIYGQERTRIITRMEVERLSIDGRKRTLDDLVIEELLYQEGLKYKIQIDESVVDRYILNIRKQYNLSLEDVKLIFKQSGYTYEEGREQLRMMYATNAIIENVIMSRLHVSREEVLAYYEKHPVIQEAQYQLQMASIHFENNKNQLDQQLEISQKIKQARVDDFVWYDSFWIKETEIAQHMNFIKDMKVGDISLPIQTPRGFEVYRLVDKVTQATVSLENRYKEIENILRQPQFQKKFEEYKKSLHEFATIVHYSNSKIQDTVT